MSQWLSKLHHDGSEIYVSNPLPKLGDKVTLRFRAPHDAPIRQAFIRSMLDGEFFMWEMTCTTDGTSQLWSGELPIQQPRTDYRFIVFSEEGVHGLTGVGVNRYDSPDYESFVILADFEAPLWVRDAVFYQIFPDRFYNGDPSNDVQTDEYEVRGRSTAKRDWGQIPEPWRKGGPIEFFGGDLQGITQKLDYLTELGVNAIYLCPIFVSETNHRYDAVDFFHVDKHLGGDEALVELREATRARGFRLMLDLTTNHVGSSHPWLKQTDKSDYFFFDAAKGAYETWLGVSSLIKLNYTSDKLRDMMYRSRDSVMRHWLRAPYAIDAWRFDVANMTGNLRQYQLDHEVWQEVRPILKGDNPEAYLLGEYFQDGTPHLQGDELDASMNYQGFNMPLRRWLAGETIRDKEGQALFEMPPMPTEAMAQQWQRFLSAIPYTVALQQFNQLDSHDVIRILNVAKYDKALVKLALSLLVSYVGTPCIYYGTEIGMEGGRDPDNRRTMEWDSTQWDHDLFEHTKRVIAIRKNSHALKHGGFHIVHAHGDTIAFLRQSPEETMLTVGYRGADHGSEIGIEVASAGMAEGTNFTDLLSGASYTVLNGLLSLGQLAHGQALILRKN